MRTTFPGRWIVFLALVLSLWLVAILALKNSAPNKPNKREAERCFSEGVSALEKEDNDAAIRCFTKVLSFDPQTDGAYRNRGVAFVRQGDYDRAIADFTRAIRLTPQLADSWLQRGYAFLLKGDYEHSVADFTEAIRREPGSADAYRW